MSFSTQDFESDWFGDDDDGLDDDAAQSLALVVGQAVGVKTFPEATRQVLHVLDNSRFRTKDLGNALEKDPGVAMKVLHTANSPAYGGARKIVSLEQAVMRLGVREIRNIVTALAVLGMFETDSLLSRSVQAHSACVGGIARFLMQQIASEHASSVFLLGLMHDVGKLLLMQSDEFDYENLSVENPEVFRAANSVHRLEREHLRFDHALVAEQVLTHWDVPQPIPRLVGAHHHPMRIYDEGDRELSIMVAVLRVADQLDYKMMESTELDDAFLHELANSSDALYAGLDGAQLAKWWMELWMVRNHALGKVCLSAR